MTPSSEHHLAQANLARLRHPPGDPRVSEFIAALDHVNRIADRAPGFVWRHPAEDGHVTLSDDDPLTVVNVSVWRSYQALHEFTYRSRHGLFVRRRREWFVPIQQPSTVLWWVTAGTTPALPDALAHLSHLRRYGPTPQAFTVRVRFLHDGSPDGHLPRARS